MNSNIDSEIKLAIDNLYKRDYELLKLGVTERAITHRLGMYLQNLFPEWDVDCEYNRMGRKVGNDFEYTEGDYFAKTVCLSTGEDISQEDDMGSRVFPDIIIHKRGTTNNLSIIEVKILGKNGKSEHDRKKVKAYLKDLQYQSGYYIEVGEFSNDNKVERYNVEHNGNFVLTNVELL